MIEINKSPECPVCGGNELKELLKRHLEDIYSDWKANILDINYVRNYILFKLILKTEKRIDFTFWLCKKCGFIFFSPRPEVKDMHIKYQFIDEVHDSEIREKYRATVSNADRRASDLFKRITRIKPLTAESKILDLGGGTGSCLKEFVRNSYECQVVDFEKRELIPGVKYLCSSMYEVPKNTLYDVILFCHTLEHIVDLNQDLSKIHDLLAPGGMVYIEVPFGCDGEYLQTRNFITHINFFSTGSLGYLLESLGFNVKKIKAEPLLTNTLYSCVIWAMAEKSQKPSKLFFTQGQRGYQITERDRRKTKKIFLKILSVIRNGMLVCRSPFAYLEGFRSRLRRKKGASRG